jgi:hypothetical protein
MGVSLVKKSLILCFDVTTRTSPATNHFKGAKRKPLVVAGLFWKPFDARFEALLDDFRFHAYVLNSELLIAQLLEAHAGRETISQQINEINERLAEAEKVQKSKNVIPTSAETRNALERQQKGLSSLISD